MFRRDKNPLCPQLTEEKRLTQALDLCFLVSDLISYICDALAREFPHTSAARLHEQQRQASDLRFSKSIRAHE